DHGVFDFTYTGEGRGWERTSPVPDGLGDGVVGYMVHEIPKGLGGYEIDLPRTPGGEVDTDALVEGFFPYMIGFPDVHEEIIVYESPFKWEILIPQILIPPALDDDNLEGIDDWDDDFGDRFVSGTGYLHDTFPLLNGEDAEDTFSVNPWDTTVVIEGDLAHAHMGWCPGADSSYGDDLCEQLGETRLKVRVKYTGKGYEGPAEINKGVWLVNEEIFGGSPWVQWSHAQFANAIGHSISFANRSATPTVVPLHPDSVLMRWRIAEWDEPTEFDIMFDPYLDGSGYGKASITTHVGGREPASLFEPDNYWMARIDPISESATITALPWATADDTILHDAGYPKTETGSFLQVLVEVNNSTGEHWYNTSVVPVLSGILASEPFLWYGCYPRPFVPQHVVFDEVTGEPSVIPGDDPRTFTAGWRFNPSADEVLFQIGESDGSITIPEIQSSRRAYFIWHIKLDPNLPTGVYEIPLKLTAMSRHYTESGPGTPVSVDVPTAKFAVVERSGGTIIANAEFISGQAQLTDVSTELMDYVDVLDPSADVRWGYSMPTLANWSTLAPISASVIGGELDITPPGEVASPWPPSIYVNNFWIGAMAEVDPPSASEYLPLDNGAIGTYIDFMGISRNYSTSRMAVEARGAKLKLGKSVTMVNGVDVDSSGYYYLTQGDNDVRIELAAQNIGNDIAYDIAIQGDIGRDAAFMGADSTYPYNYDAETKTVYWADFAHIPPGAERKIPIDLVVNASGSDEVLELFYAFAVEFTETDESGEVLPTVRYRPSDDD
ncbi:MAG: hypothetical protein ACP5G4_08420, partial [bacterium]